MPGQERTGLWELYISFRTGLLAASALNYAWETREGRQVEWTINAKRRGQGLWGQQWFNIWANVLDMLISCFSLPLNEMTN